MAQRATPSQYFQAKMRTEVTAPPQQPLPVQQAEALPPTIQFPEINNTAIFVLGIVGLFGFFALIAYLASDRKCSR
jgi:hypothetical protein